MRIRVKTVTASIGAYKKEHACLAKEHASLTEEVANLVRQHKDLLSKITMAQDTIPEPPAASSVAGAEAVAHDFNDNKPTEAGQEHPRTWRKALGEIHNSLKKAREGFNKDREEGEAGEALNKIHEIVKEDYEDFDDDSGELDESKNAAATTGPRVEASGYLIDLIDN